MERFILLFFVLIPGFSSGQASKSTKRKFKAGLLGDPHTVQWLNENKLAPP
jgi:hypothetical protein